jgi:hypothetical protein
MEFKVRPYMWSGDGPRYTSPDEPGVRVVCSDVFDSYGRMVGSIFHEPRMGWWQIRRDKGEFSGEYASQDEALAALQAA